MSEQQPPVIIDKLFRNIMPTMELQYKLAIDQILEAGLEKRWQAYALMHDGGPCPVCGVPFKRAVGKNLDGSAFVYYLPGCYCFHTCQRCLTVMIEERLLGQTWCFNCQSPPKEPKKKKKTIAERAKEGKDAAAGDNQEAE